MSLVAQEVLICHFCGEAITKLSGVDSDSLLNHHITYIPEVIVPTHRGCHTKYHSTHPKHPKSPEGEYRKRLITSGEDVFCYFCGESITRMNGQQSESLIIHSLDNNHNNWDPSNKVPAHSCCHVSYHMSELRADPNSVYNSPAYRIEHVRGCKKIWKDPIALQNKSDAMVESWVGRRKKFASSGFSEDGLKRLNPLGAEKPQIWATRRDRYGSRGIKNPQEYSKNQSRAQKRRWVWNKLAQMFEMLFDDIVDEEAETFPCPYCNRVFSKIGWLKMHMSIQHMSREQNELDLSSLLIIKKIGVNTNG